MRCLAIITAILFSLVQPAVSAHATIVNAADYPSLQDAADAIPASGGVLQIPPGTHHLQTPLRIKTGDTQVIGFGASTNLINQNTEGLPAILIENPAFSAKATPSQERLWRVSVTNLRITGNAKSGAGIEARYIEEIHIHSVSCSYNGGDGFHLHFCYEDPRINDNLLTYNKKCGVSLEGCHDIIVSANQFEENQDALRCIDSFNLTMNGNNIDDHLGNGVIIEDTYGSVLSGNMIEECQGWAIILDRDCYGITISANVIAHDFSGGIDLRDAHGCAISANTFTLVKKTGIAVRSESASITITGNNFCDTWVGNDAEGKAILRRDDSPTKTEANPNEAAGVLLQACQQVVLSGNLFSRLSNAAIIEEDTCRDIIRNGNAIFKR
ncbi:right-handed parallel beta-helix repeat-containing protein [Aureliella helgolandensis]|uniref:Pectate lyase superfamily protein n=1 Tax=Aureliella helgolandensis TaxID=2527968 RepID=A0A518GA46_9BACT|nr:right-handed parallel beta-helix repeat-containing protein [Aureliella helgolandensis]QDV25476.1 Pectate lyase superfamily protein [Aureliella helgolandensis]